MKSFVIMEDINFINCPEYDIRIWGPCTPAARFNITYAELDCDKATFKTEVQADAFQFALSSELGIPSDVSEHDGSWSVTIKSSKYYFFDDGIGERSGKSITVMECRPPFEIIKINN